jgi:VWFA-related protein
MCQPNTFSLRTLLLVAASLYFFINLPLVRGQQQPAQNKSSQQDEDVLRIKTELVQTDLMVFDKQGRFVEGLKPEQFELTLDGKSQPISFFERVATGSAREAAQVSAARSGSQKSNEQSRTTTIAASGNQGRVVVFFLDDLHLSESSLMRARKALSYFVENQMSQNDRVAIVSASGQIGFLQQLTDYKPVLTAAIARLNYKKNPETYAGKVPISDYQATQIVDHGDRELFTYLLAATMNEYQSKGALMRVAANIVKNRVRQTAAQSKMTTNDLLGVLESLMQSSASMPGRKLVFFISDGFITDVRGSSAMSLLKHVTEMAARTGIVVYTMDARGTFNDPAVDASRNEFPDGLATGTQARNPTMEASALQEPLHILAEDTGGRAIINSNSFKDAFQQAINETSDYYLLAWRPDDEEQRGGKARIKVGIKDRPDLRVRLRRNYYVPPPAEASPKKEDEKSANTSLQQAQTPEAGLLNALGSLYPHRTLPTALSVGYVQETDNGLSLKASMQIEREALAVTTGEAQRSEIDVLGAAIDDRGVIVTFKQVLTVTPDPSTQNQRQPVVWNQQLKLPPGLYQVRVAVRERGTGRTGGAMQWIEVPEFTPARFQMSSLFLGEREAMEARDGKSLHAARAVMVNVAHRFPRSSVLRFQTYVYNATHEGVASPNVEIEARVLRDNHSIIVMPPMMLPVNTVTDKTRLPYWAEVPLAQLPPGRYTLRVTATDRTTRSVTSQQTSFVVE